MKYLFILLILISIVYGLSPIPPFKPDRLIEIKSDAGYPNVWNMLMNIDKKKFQFITMNQPADMDPKDAQMIIQFMESDAFKMSADRSLWINRAPNTHVAKFSINFFIDDKYFEFFQNNINVPKELKEIANLINKYAQIYKESNQKQPPK